MNCVYCKGNKTVKNGTKTLKTNQVVQQSLCKDCQHRFNERSRTPMKRLRTPVETIEMAVKVRNEGLGVRATGRVVGKSASRITAWEERLSKHLKN
jgi:transposase-like protein